MAPASTEAKEKFCEKWIACPFVQDHLGVLGIVDAALAEPDFVL